MATTGKSTPAKAANKNRMTLISSKAKEIRKNGEEWKMAIKRASDQLKKEGKL